jgi:hypothetical protein
MKSIVGVLSILLISGSVACTQQPPVAPMAPTNANPVVGTPSVTAPAGSTTSGLVAALPPQPSPDDWAPEITNPWLPFVPGTTLTYTGMKDGQPTVDTYVVTARKKVVNGAPATVVLNTLRTGKHEIEGTEDWYAQDKQGNVWYLGEATQTFDKNGRVLSTTGSWQAGVNGAEAGLFMPAEPNVGGAHYQEYYRGHAEDAYKIISVNGTITVPYGTYKNAVVTQEMTALEPNIISQKYYIKGIGQVYENDIKGSTEYAKLVSVKKR